MYVIIGTAQIKNKQSEKLLGVKIDTKLFVMHIQQICGKARTKLKVLGRITPFMKNWGKIILVNAFFNAQFSYCPLTWMSHSRKLNNEINRMHEKCLWIVYDGNTLSYDKFLEIDNYVSAQIALKHCPTLHRKFGNLF